MLEAGEQLGLGVEKHFFPKKRKMKTRCGWSPTLRYNLVQDEGAFDSMLATLRANEKERVAWDTETSGLKPELGARIIGHCFATRTGENELSGWYVPIRHVGASNMAIAQLEPDAIRERLQEFFAQGDAISTHHGKFDRKQARADRIEIHRQMRDVAIGATIRNENEPKFGLKPLSAKYLNPKADSESKVVDQWMQKDARRLGMSFKRHSVKRRKLLVARHGLDGLSEPTYLQRFGHSRVPIHLEGLYGIHDAAYTWLLDRTIYHDVEQRFPQLWTREHKVADLLFEAEWHGLPVDPAVIRDTHMRLKEAVEYWLATCRALCPQFIDHTFQSTDGEIRKLFFEHLGMEPVRFTEKEQPSVDKVARKLLVKAHPQHKEIIEAISQLATTLKLFGTYAGSFLAHYSPTTGNIHPSYNQLEERKEGGVPVTGRLSSSEPNAQNIAGRPLHLHDCVCDQCIETAEAEGFPDLSKWRADEQVRRLSLGLRVENTVAVQRYFVVPDGWVRAYIDFSQIELRVLAWFCQDPTMLRAFREGIDLHQLIADELGITRKIAKQVNFGLSYGLTEIGLALRMPGYYDDPEGTQEMAKEVLQAYFHRYPRINVFRREFARDMRANGGQFVNPFGRPRRIEEITDEKPWVRTRAERRMMSSIISGTSADLMKESLIRATPIAHAFGGIFRQTIHDEAVFDLPMQKGWAQTVVDIKNTMEDWPLFSEDRPDLGRQGVPIGCSVELVVPPEQRSWAEKREIEVFPDGTMKWAA